MRVAEPVAASWKARLSLAFQATGERTVLSGKSHDGPLVVQKPLYPEGDAVCHTIIVHPPGGIAGGDELDVEVTAERASHTLLTTPGAAKWYRSAGPWARQRLSFTVNGCLEWLPQETIVYDAALADMQCDVELSADARYVGWEIVCLGRTGSGERFTRGKLRIHTRISREGKLLWFERGSIEGGGKLMNSPAGLGGRSVCATLVACGAGLNPSLLADCRKLPGVSVTLLPEILVARHLGDSSEEAKRRFTALWRILRPALCGREAVSPRIWQT
ncbi:MAG: hypothetical protein A3H97_02260 [Acidobacteria bacterium RIFCSPLOWO2_02_FULL_65_29]|nr:MAG: hypothetical protein A3H97_02260 [Acidobacteria bacterium RIFCSPLOWO2_02_FULL_65_29]